MKRLIVLGGCFLATSVIASPAVVSKLRLAPGVEASISQGPLKVVPGSKYLKYQQRGDTMEVIIPRNMLKQPWWKSWFVKTKIHHYHVSISIPDLQQVSLAKQSTVKVSPFKVNTLQFSSPKSNFVLHAHTTLKLSYNNNQLATNLHGGSIEKFTGKGNVGFSANAMTFNNLTFSDDQSAINIRGAGQLNRLQTRPQAVFIALKQARLSKVALSGKVVFLGDALTSDNLSFWANNSASLIMNAKHMLIPSITWQAGQLNCLFDDGAVRSITTNGPVIVSGHHMHGENMQLAGYSGKLNIKGTNFNVLDMKISHNDTSAIINQGTLNSLSTTGHARAVLNHIQYRPHRMQIKNANVSGLDLQGQGFISKLVVTGSGLNMDLAHGKLQHVKLTGNANLVATDMDSKTLSAGNGRDTLHVAGSYHIKKLHVDAKGSNLLVNDHPVFTKINLKNNATVFGKNMRAQHGLHIKAAANGNVVVVGNVTVTQTTSPKGGTTVALSDGTLQQLMVRGNVHVHGTDIYSTALQLNAKAHAAVDLQGQIGIKSVIANDSGPIQLQLALGDALNIVETGSSHVTMAGNVKSISVKLSGHSVLTAPYMRVTDALVRTEDSSQANVLVYDALRTFAYGTSNIYYYKIPKHLTIDPHQRGNVLHVFSKQSRKLMFSKPSEGFGDQM